MKTWDRGKKRLTEKEKEASIKWQHERVKIANLIARKPEIQKICCICGKEGKILHNRKNPYSSSSDYDKYNYLRWNSEHYKKIHEYEEKYRQLDCKKELTDEEKREVEITKYFNDLLLEDYGLTRNSFIEEKNGINFDSYKVSELKKTLVKKMPNLTITNHIKYL